MRREFIGELILALGISRTAYNTLLNYKQTIVTWVPFFSSKSTCDIIIYHREIGKKHAPNYPRTSTIEFRAFKHVELSGRDEKNLH